MIVEIRLRVPERLAEYAPLLDVGIRHLLAARDGVLIDRPKEPMKQIRLKAHQETLNHVRAISEGTRLKFSRVVIEALELARTARLNPEALTSGSV